MGAMILQVAEYRDRPHNETKERPFMNINVSLTDELAKFIDAQVATGRYASSSEVVQEALRLMERLDQAEAEKLSWLQDAWRRGIDSGDAGEIDFGELKQEARRRLAAKS
jgi:antitoxin ParD1/3/4